MYTQPRTALSILFVMMTVACSDQVEEEPTPWELLDQEAPDDPTNLPSPQPDPPTPNPIPQRLTALDGLCALNDAHELVCWGAMSPYSATPQRFKKISTWRGLCGVTLEDQARCYEIDDNGQPRSVDFIERGLADQKVLDIARSGTSTCVALANEAPLCWRDDRIGLAEREGKALADVAYRISNVDELHTLVAGTHRFCGLNAAGQAYCWGVAPEQLDQTPPYLPDHQTAHLLDAGRAWRSIDVYNAFCGVDQAGTLRCNYPHDDLSVAIDAPIRGDRFAQVKLSVKNGCARTEAGRLYCWGKSNAFGQLGLEAPTLEQPQPSATLKPVHTTERFIDFSGGGSESNCGLTDNKQVLCWGARKTHDNLGQGAQMFAKTPQPVMPAQRWRAVTTNGQSACALGADAKVYCWGRDLSRRQEQGNALEHPTPQPLDTSSAYEALRMGSTMACAQGLNQQWSCWGKEEDVAQATGRTTPYAPLALPDQTTLKHISLSQTQVPFGCGLDLDQKLVCWGTLPLRADPQERTSPHAYDPVQARTHSTPTHLYPTLTWSSIALFSDNVCGLNPQGLLLCWGDHFTSRPISAPADGGPMPVNADKRWTSLHAPSPEVLCVKDSLDALHCMTTPLRIAFIPTSSLDHLKPIESPIKPAKVFVHADELCVSDEHQRYACAALSALKGQAPIRLEAKSNHIDASFQTMTPYASTAFGITPDGQLMAWGHNHWGLLANGVETFKTTPVLATAINAVNSPR